MKTKTIILGTSIIAALATITTATIMDEPGDPTGPTGPTGPDGFECHVAPDILNDNVKKCYEDECVKFRKAHDECNGEEICELLARINYEVAVGICASLPAMETSDNLVIWQNDQGDWTVAWPGEEFEIFAPKFDFNI